MNIIQKVKELDLPDGSFVVVGSGTMAAFGIREPNDLDLVVSPEVYEKLKQEGWEQKFRYGTSFLGKNVYEIWLMWDSENNEPNLKDLLKNAHIIDGVPFVNIRRLMEWKKRKGRDKDLTDVELIKDYLEKQS